MPVLIAILFRVRLFVFNTNGFRDFKAFFLVIFIYDFCVVGKDLSFFGRSEFIGVITICCCYMLLDGTSFNGDVLIALDCRNVVSEFELQSR